MSCGVGIFRFVRVAFVLVLAGIIVGCEGNDDSGDGIASSASVAAVERWEIVSSDAAADARGYDLVSEVWIFSKDADGNITVEGSWDVVDAAGKHITASLSGTATVSGSSVTATASGTANYPAYQSTSPVTSTMQGTMSAGQGNGTFTENYTADGWPSENSGAWTAVRTSGSGITL